MFRSHFSFYLQYYVCLHFLQNTSLYYSQAFYFISYYSGPCSFSLRIIYCLRCDLPVKLSFNYDLLESVHLFPAISELNLIFIFYIQISMYMCICLNERETKADFISLVQELLKSLKPVHHQLSEEGEEGLLAPNLWMFAGQQVRGLWKAGRCKTQGPMGTSVH